jgi:hypothetical protein
MTCVEIFFENEFSGTVDYGRTVVCRVIPYSNYIHKMFIRVNIDCQNVSEIDSSNILSIDSLEVIINGLVIDKIFKRFHSYFIGRNHIFIPLDLWFTKELKYAIPLKDINIQIKVKFTDFNCGDIKNASLFVDYHDTIECSNPDDHVECLKQIPSSSGLVSAKHLKHYNDKLDEVKDTVEDTVAMSQPAKKRKIEKLMSESGAA